MLFSPRTIGIAAALAGFLALSAWLPFFRWLGLLGNLALLFAVLVDLLMVRPGEGLTFTRRLGEGAQGTEGQPHLVIGADNPVIIEVTSRRPYPSGLVVKDDPPQSMEWPLRQGALSVPPLGSATFTYSVQPTRRGEYRFGDLALREPGRLGLVVRQWRVPAAAVVRVYPDISATRRYETLVLRGRLREVGGRRSLLVGGGREFSSLREFLPDDEFRSVDWKASARRMRLITRQYDVERSQRVVVLLDAGRLMGVEAGALTKLDYAINSALVLAYVALALGDQVGLLSFAEALRGYVPPGRGPGQLRRLLESTYALQPVTLNPSFAEADLQLRARLRKRALLVVFTDLTDPETASSAIRHLALLSRRHLCLCLTVGDPEVARWARAEPETDRDVYRQAVALSVLESRRRALASLSRNGVVVQDALPDRLTAAAVTRYLALKDAGAI